jgi:signal transduction histidine kinase
VQLASTQVVRTPQSLSYRSFAPATGPESGEIGGDVFLRQIIETCASNVAVLDESGAVLYLSRRWSETNAEGESSEPDALIGEKLRLSNGDGPDPFAEDLRRILDGCEREVHKEYCHAGPNRTTWFRIDAARLNLPHSNSLRVLVTRENVTRHKQAEEALRNLGGQLIRAQEDERRRVARELHDDLNQRLAIMSLELEQLGLRVPKDREDLSVSVGRLRVRAQEISSEIHRLSHQLHPAKLDHLGLAAGIKALCVEVSEHHQIEIDFRLNGFPAVLSPDVTLCVYRVAQESLHNIIKHSGARTAKIDLKKTSKAIHLRVLDTGCGFDTGSTGNGLGLISMKERLRLAGGTITIRSRSMIGTQIDVQVPLEASA